MRGMFSSEVTLDGAGRSGWWLVARSGGLDRAVAGPFADRLEAEWTAGPDGLDDHAGPAGPAGVRAVHGVARADGRISPRPSAEDWAWLAALGEQLDRLPEAWDAGMDEDEPLGTLVVEVVAALVEAGLALADPAGAGGGVGLLPEPGLGGLVLSWRQHDRMSRDRVHGVPAEAGVQELMTRTAADLLTLRGFRVEAFGDGAALVRC